MINISKTNYDKWLIKSLFNKAEKKKEEKKTFYFDDKKSTSHLKKINRSKYIYKNNFSIKKKKYPDGISFFKFKNDNNMSGKRMKIAG